MNPVPSSEKEVVVGEAPVIEYNDRLYTKIRMSRTSVPTLYLCGVGRRFGATVRIVHQQGEVRDITREAGQSESSSLLSTPRGRKFTRKAIHPVKRGRAKIAVCTRHFCRRHFCTRTLSANQEGLGRCPNQSYRGNQLIP